MACSVWKKSDGVRSSVLSVLLCFTSLLGTFFFVVKVSSPAYLGTCALDAMILHDVKRLGPMAAACARRIIRVSSKPFYKFPMGYICTIVLNLLYTPPRVG